MTLCFEKGRVNKKKKGNKDGVRGRWVGSLIECFFKSVTYLGIWGYIVEIKFGSQNEIQFKIPTFPLIFSILA